MTPFGMAMPNHDKTFVLYTLEYISLQNIRIILGQCIFHIVMVPPNMFVNRNRAG